MNRINLILLPLILFLFSFNTPDSKENNGTITVKVLALKSRKGTIRSSLFKSEDGFPGDVKKAIKKMDVKIEPDGVVTFKYTDVPFGTYAVAVMHDENNNNEMDTNFIGIPKEGIGVSNNAKARFGPPKYEEAKFKLDSDNKEISINLIYM